MPLLCALAALAAAPGWAELAQGERDRAMSHLHATRKGFLDVVANLANAQWTFKPDARTWSVAEVAEHITLSEDTLFERVTKTILSSPADPSRKAEIAGKDETVLAIIADRSRKVQAPEMLMPAHRWPDRRVLIEHFKNSRARTIRYVQTTRDELRLHFAPHPAAGTLDAYQWLLLLSAHTERHIAQMREVMEHPGFPRSGQ